MATLNEDVVVVVVLDNDPTVRAEAWGWSGHELFRGKWNATPEQVAHVVGLHLECTLAVHSVTRSGHETWIALRSDTRYAKIASLQSASSIRARPPTSPAEPRDTSPSMRPTFVPPSWKGRASAIRPSRSGIDP